MKAAVLSLAAVTAAVVVAGCGGGSSTPSPTHVAATFFDGINVVDLRQACSQLVKANRESMPACEANMVGWLGQIVAFYGLPHYQVVAHSAKTWTQKYRGRDVELAVVNATVRGQDLLLHAHLRKTPDGWKIWTIESVS